MLICKRKIIIPLTTNKEEILSLMKVKVLFSQLKPLLHFIVAVSLGT